MARWSGSLGGEYTLPVRLGELFQRQPGAGAAGRWEVALFARNLFNRNYLQNVTVQAGNSGLIVGTPSDPSMLGATLRRSW